MEKRLDDLGINNLKIYQCPEYFCFGVDAVILSHFAQSIKDNADVMDIGTGNGILPLLLSAKTKAKNIVGVEIQEELYQLANENVELNNLTDRIKIVNCDIKEIEKKYTSNSFDAIVTNPPYKKENSGIVNDNTFIQIAKHEIKCTLEDIFEKCKYLLKDRGELYMVHRPDRLVDIISLGRKYSLEPKEIRYVHSKINQAPILILVKFIKYAKPFLKTHSPLIIYNENGEYTEEIYDIYGKDIEYEKR